MSVLQTVLLTSRRLSQGLTSHWRNYYYRALGVKLHGYTWMRDIEIPHSFSGIEIESGCALDRGVTLLCFNTTPGKTSLYIGAGTYINRNTFLDASLSLSIGKSCAIGPGCYITDHDHGTEPGGSPLEKPLIAQPTCIGDRVWIGAHVTILKGVMIGNDAVIGAGSVVTKDIPERAVAVGVPAKAIKLRSIEEEYAAHQ